jgi:hypothetical protein
MPEKEHFGIYKKSKLFPEDQLQMEHFTIKDGSSRAEINPQPQKSRSSGRKWLLLASGCVSAIGTSPT